MASFTDTALGFGIAFYLKDQFSGVAKDVEARIKSLGGETEKMVASVNNAMKMMSVGTALTATGVGALAIFKKASDVRAEFQAYEVQFHTLLGSAEKASEMMSKIKKDAADNPIFGTQSLVEANAAMLATKKVTEEGARSVTNNLAEILAGVGKGDVELSRMATNLQGIANTGKASEIDIKQFMIAGIPMWTLLEESTGKTTEELKKMDITFDMVSEAFSKATAKGGAFYKATERMANSTKGLKAAVEDNIELSFERIGFALEDVTRNMYASLRDLTDQIKTFVESPFGQRVVKWIAYGAGLLAIFGTTLVVVGAMKLAFVKLQVAMLGSSLAAVKTAFATQGLSAGLKVLGASLWTSLGPFIVVAGVMYGVWKISNYLIEAFNKLSLGFEEFTDKIPKGGSGGILGFFEKTASVIKAFIEIWNSWDGGTGFISEDLFKKMEHLGMDWILPILADTIEGIKDFFSGIWSVVQPVWEMLKEFGSFLWAEVVSTFESVWGAFSDIFSLISSLIATIFGKANQALGEQTSVWKLLGKALAFVATGSIKILIPILKIVIRVIASVAKVIAWVVSGIVQGIMWLFNNWTAIWDAIKGVFFGFIDSVWNAISFFFDIGVTIVSGLWNGISGMWESFTTWITEKITALIDMIVEPLKSAWGSIKEFFGFGDEDVNVNVNNGNTPINTDPNNPLGAGAMLPNTNNYHFDHTTKSPVFISPNSSAPATMQSAPITLQMTMDGDLISQKVIDRQEFRNSRNH